MKRIIPFITFVLGVLLTFTVMTYVFPPEPVTVEKIVEVEAEPEIVYKDRVEYKEKIVYQERLTDLEQVIADTKKSCVMIYAYFPNGSISQCSGWIYNKRVVTVKHGVEGAHKVDIFLDGSSTGANGHIKYVDDKLDLAVIEFDRIADSVVLGDSDKLKGGERVIGIISPEGIPNMIDECIYSGTEFINGEYVVILSESIVDPGASGGAVFNYSSEIIGMVYGGGRGSGIAIPINEIKPILDKIE